MRPLLIVLACAFCPALAQAVSVGPWEITADGRAVAGGLTCRLGLGRSHNAAIEVGEISTAGPDGAVILGQGTDGTRVERHLRWQEDLQALLIVDRVYARAGAELYLQQQFSGGIHGWRQQPQRTVGTQVSDFRSGDQRDTEGVRLVGRNGTTVQLVVGAQRNPRKRRIQFTDGGWRVWWEKPADSGDLVVATLVADRSGDWPAMLAQVRRHRLADPARPRLAGGLAGGRPHLLRRWR